MAGGKFSEANLFGMTIRESATDGSDFTNPDADYRRLFLGEDGYLHVKDSAGSVTDPYPAGASVATDTIWDAAGDLAVGTGANTAAKLVKGAAGANLSTYNGTVAWNGGTSFPASPATGDRYWRSDLGRECYYDGTRWLTTTEFRITGVGPDLPGTSSATPNLGRAVIPTSLDIYVTTIDISTFIATTNDGTKYWTFTFSKVDVTNGSPVSLGSFTTAADTASNWTHHQVVVNAVVATASYFVLTGSGAKTSTPGAPSWHVTYGYRLVIT